MPIPRKSGATAAPAPAPTTGGIRRRSLGPAMGPAGESAPAPEADVTPDEGGSINPLLMVGGAAAGMGGLAYLGSKMANMPGVLGKVGKAAGVINALRQQLMLSGQAVPKSILGNIGAATNASAERASLEPLKKLFSGQTVRDAVDSFKSASGAIANPVGHSVNLPKALSLPGRIMGSLDEATQKALQRAGMTAEESARETLQAPLTGSLARIAHDNPIAQYLVPFRRTPFNQFIEGFESMSPEALSRNPLTAAAYMGAGAIHGAATADDQQPVSLGLGAAFAGRRAVPYTLAAILARHLSGGKTDPTLAGSLTPVSDYGITSSLVDPTKAFTQPAALTALKKFGY